MKSRLSDEPVMPQLPRRQVVGGELADHLLVAGDQDGAFDLPLPADVDRRHARRQRRLAHAGVAELPETWSWDDQVKAGKAGTEGSPTSCGSVMSEPSQDVFW